MNNPVIKYDYTWDRVLIIDRGNQYVIAEMRGTDEEKRREGMRLMARLEEGRDAERA